MKILPRFLATVATVALLAAAPATAKSVPLDQMTGFTTGIFEQQLVPEASKHTQEMYAILDTVVQAVLTDKNANIDQLLADANTKAQRAIDAAG